MLTFNVIMASIGILIFLTLIFINLKRSGTSIAFIKKSNFM